MTLDELIDEGLAGRLTWAEVQRRASHVPTWFELAGTHPLDEAAWREHIGPTVRPWHAGASVEEVLAFGLRPGYEAYVQLLETDELGRQLSTAVARSEDPARRTRWLERYTTLLVAERLRRRGVA